MASETVDPIDWPHPPPTLAVPPERLVHSINRCSSVTAGIERATLQPSACEATTLPMRPLRVYKSATRLQTLLYQTISIVLHVFSLAIGIDLLSVLKLKAATNAAAGVSIFVHLHLS